MNEIIRNLSNTQYYGILYGLAILAIILMLALFIEFIRKIAKHIREQKVELARKKEVTMQYETLLDLFLTSTDKEILKKKVVEFNQKVKESPLDPIYLNYSVYVSNLFIEKFC